MTMAIGSSLDREDAVATEIAASRIGKLERVPLRQVWRHEEYDLTAWLEENPDVLRDAIGIDFVKLEREVGAGSFRVDLRGEDKDGGIVIVENQLGRSDHDHLGKLLTYLAVLDARVAVWIVADPRPEHVSAVSWLNQSGLAQFFLLKLEAVRIGNSDPAPLLTRITGPSEEVVQAGDTKKQLAERHVERQEFWTELLARSRPRTKLFAKVSASRDNWLQTGSGRSGITFMYTIWEEQAAADLWIGLSEEAESRQVFEGLYRRRPEIEERFGEQLDWQPLEGRKGSRIRKMIVIGGYRSEEPMRSQAIDALIDAMIRLEHAVRPYLPVTAARL
jgi:hypothetical protein